MDNNILYVGGSGPGNYSSIQDAIDNTTDHDIVFVYDDSSPYFENIIIDKSLNLKGENKITTIIDGNNIGDVIFISANSVNITGFTIQNSGNINRNAGIKIQSKNNKIFDSILSDNYEGIGISSTSYNTISGNIISNNDYGIRFFAGSNNNLILNNNVFLNKFRGIRFEGSYNNIISDNNIINNGNGVRFEDSDKNNFSGNLISDNGIGLDIISSFRSIIVSNNFINDGLQVQDSYNNTISNNTVNGKPLIYLEEESNRKIEEAGQILLVNCENITIQNQNLYNVTYGILLWQTNNSLITGNILYSNDFDGILLHSSSNNSIEGNEISSSDNGIALDFSGNNNKIIDNKISNNSYGIHIYYSTSNTNISRNNISNNQYGVQLYDSHDFTIYGNNFSNNYFGVSLWQFSSNNFIFLNNFFNCVDGIWLNKVNDNILLRNTIYRSEFNGIWILESLHNKMTENNIINCKCSVELTDSRFNIISENEFFKGGIFTFNSFYNTVTNNTVNSKPLVYLEEETDIIVGEAGQVILINCENVTVQNKKLFDLIIGIELWHSDYCQITNNSLFDNYHGTWLLYSNNNSFSNNIISNSIEQGLFLFSSDDNLISKNNISKNKDGIILESSSKNIIVKNNIESNEAYGILMMNSCNKNDIIRNALIKNSEYGIYLDESFYNKIKNNNFIENNQSACFKVSMFNRWIKNYWAKFRILPKPISGKIKINSIFIPWINIDWRPAKKPFSI